jgi:type II secretory pathway pseudopilin PulG
MLAVMVVILVLAGMVAGLAGYARREARRKRATAQLKAIEIALGSYVSDWGYYPQQASAADLTATFWDGLDDPRGKAYIDYTSGLFAFEDTNADGIRGTGENIRDAYGNAFRYQCPGTHNVEQYDLSSKGMDGVAGTTDDLNNWEPL